MPAPYAGGCQCGQVRYEITAEPLRTTGCHCLECQKQSGSAFGLALHVRPGDMRVKGRVKSHTRIADSGKPMTGVFCPDCGVRLYNIPGVEHDLWLVKPGTLDDTSRVRPERLVWTRRKQPWVRIPDGVRTFPDDG